MNRIHSPTELEFHTEEWANNYVKAAKVVMGKTFVIEADGKVVKMKRPMLLEIHRKIMAGLIRPEKHEKQRVYAIQEAKEGTVYLFGFGVYEGDEIPDRDAAGLAAHIRASGTPNPKIKLDNGQIVWGCECWWGPEELFQKQFGHCKIVNVDIHESRMAQKGELN